MPNSYYNHSTFPVTGSAATSQSMRAELDLIAAGFDKLPGLTGNANRLVSINGTATGLTTISTSAQLATAISDETGTGYLVFSDAPTLNNPVIVGGSYSPTTLVVPAGTGSTTEGVLQWSTSGDLLTIGTGAATKTFVDLNTSQTLTGKTISGATNTLTNIGNGSLTNSSVTIGSTSLSLGGTLTSLAGVTISGATNTLTNIGNGSLTNSSVTIGSTSLSLGGTLTSLAGVTISGATNTLTNIGNGSLTNSSVTIGSTSLSLGGTLTSLAGVTISGATNTLTNIGNSSLTNSSITINGNTVALGGSTTVTATATNALTIGTGLSGTSYNGSAPVTIAIDSSVVTLNGSQVLTNKTISGSSNTLSNIGNSSLTNSSVTIGSTNISLGTTASTLAGLNSVTATSFVGALTGNADTATTLANTRTIWGQNFNGSANVTGALTGVTDITASGSVTLSGGTANGVSYLNGSKVLTTGSALTFDGLNGGTTGSWQVGNLISTGGGYIRVNRSDNLTYNEIKYATGDLFYFNQANGGSYQFNISGSEQMRLTSTGLGIGTSSPTQPLSIAKAGAAYLDLAGGSRTLGTNSFTLGQAGDGVVAFFQRENAAMYWATNSTERMRLDPSGNLGLGVTPSAWSGVTALQISRGALSGVGDAVSLSANAYYNSGWKYIASGVAATYYDQFQGSYRWFNAPSGTAGSAISFTQAMTLDASGNLLIGTTTNTSPTSTVNVYRQYGGANQVGITATVGDNSGGGSGGYTIKAISKTDNGGGGQAGYCLYASSPYDGSNASGNTYSLFKYGLYVDDLYSYYGVNESANYANYGLYIKGGGTNYIAGNLGIGTSSPATTLQARKDSAGATTYPIYADNGAAGAGTNVAAIGFSNAGAMKSSITAAVYGNDYMTFNVGGSGTTERMRIDSSGNLLINTTTGSYKLTLNGQPGANGYTAWTNYSDARLKENVTDFTTETVLDKVCSLRPVTFNYNDKTGFDEETRQRRISGFIAQELQQVFPDMVGAVEINGDEYMDTNLSNLTLYLLQAVKELSAKVAALEAK